MTKISAWLAFFAVAFVGAGCVLPQKQVATPRVSISPVFNAELYPRLAVFVVDQTRDFDRTGAIRQVEDEFMRAALEKGYTLAARSDVEKILEEQNLQQSDLTEQQIAEIGRILNVPAVLIASINSASAQQYSYSQGGSYYLVDVSISARLLSVELGEVLWISSYTGRLDAPGSNREARAQTLPPVAQVVARGLPLQKSRGFQ